MAISRLQEQNEWETAYICLEEAYAHRNEMLTIYTREVECELLFTALVTGRTARALRTLLRACALKSGKHLSFEIVTDRNV